MKKNLLVLLGMVIIGSVFYMVMQQSKPNVEVAAPPALPSAEETAPVRSQLPPGITTYISTTTPFAVSYPSFYVPRVDSDVPAGFSTVPPVVSISSPSEERAGTNLIESSVIVGVSADTATAAACTQMRDGESELGSIDIDGALFGIFTQDGAAAGNFYQIVRYRASRNNLCYEISLLMHSGNISNYPEGVVVEFDRPLTLERLKAILYSFKFTIE